MADEIVAIYRAEVEQYRKNVESLILSLGRLDAAQNKATQSASTAFTKVDAASSVVGKNIDSTTQKVLQLEKAEEKAGRSAVVEFGKAGKAVNDFAANTNNADKALNNMDNGVLSLTTNLKTMAAAIGIAFTIDRVVAFAKESIKVAAAAEGVERAFKRIGSPQLLEGLRRATRGTVSDLQLMQNAVKASNFQIPLDQLASLFKFAQQRARETGESVDYLVDSIILGIGRKSPLILDNLGISAVALREKFNGISAEVASVGDIAKAVGEIAEEAMSKVGDEVDTTADKIAQLDTVFVNFQKKAGDGLVNILTLLAKDFGLVDRNAKAVQETTEALAKVSLSALTKELEKQKQVEQELYDILQKARDHEISASPAEIGRMRERYLQQREIVGVIEETIKARDREVNGLNDLDFISEKQLRSQLAKYDALNTGQKEQIRNVFFLTAAIQALNDEIKNEATSRERIKVALQEIIPLQKELDELLNTQNNGLAGSLQRINYELGIIKTELDGAVAGSGDFWNALDRLTAKTKELTEAQAMLKFNDDTIDADPEISLSRREHDIEQQAYLDRKKNREDFNKWLKEQDEKRLQEILENDRAQAEIKQAQLEQQMELIVQYANVANTAIGLISQAQANASAYELMVLESQLERGAITRSEYDEERKKIMREQANDAKSAAIFQGIINGIVATINAFRDGGPVLAAITAALVAVQVGIIAAEPIPAFAKGVIDLQGAGTETSDSIPAMLSKRESVMTADETKKYKPVLTAIRKGTLEKLIHDKYVRPAIDAAMLNGFADMGKSAALQDKFNDMNLLRAIDRHRDSEVKELRQMNTLLGRFVRQPKRGYA